MRLYDGALAERSISAILDRAAAAGSSRNVIARGKYSANAQLPAPYTADANHADHVDSPAPGTARRRTKAGWRWLGALVLLTVAGYLAMTRLIGMRAAPAAAPRPATPVTVARAVRGNLKVYLNALGSVSPFYMVTLKTRVEGQLLNVDFKEGQSVHAGQLLAQIDPRPYQIQMQQAAGQLAKDEAALTDARITLTRDASLYTHNVISQQDLDNQRATLGEYQGAVMTDRAAIANAQLQLAYCRITAPISGRIGLRLVDPGNMVYPTDPRGLAVITQLRPIAVLFSLPEDNLPEVARAMRAGPLVAEAWNRSFTDQLETGTLLTTNNQIDQSTGTIQLKAVFANSDNMLFPNQFVNVKLLVNTLRDAILAPAAALQKSPEGTFVFVVDANHVVATRRVTVGASQGGWSAIETGLKPGEMVVIEGVDKLRAGARVQARIAANAPPGDKAP